MNDFNVKFTSQADTTGASKMKGAVKDVTNEANKKGGGGVFDDLKKHSGELFDHIKGEFPTIGTLGGLFTKLATGPVGIAVTAVGALAGAFEVAAESIKAFSAAQEKQVGLDAALAQRGQLTEDYREKLQELAETLKESTGIDDDKWKGVLTTLSKFGANTSNIEEYAEAVKNLAGFMGGDIESAAMMFGRAMNGNFTALSRYGITVDKSATKTEKLHQVMEQLATRGGGQLEARSQTLSGQMARLALAIEDVFKGIGNLLSRSGVLQTTLTGLTSVINKFAGIFPTTIERVGNLTNKLPELDAAFKNTGASASATGDEMDGVGTSAEGMASGGVKKAEDAIERLRQKFADASEAARTFQKQQDEIADSELAEKLEKIDADGSLSDAEKLKKKNELRRKNDEDKFNRSQGTDSEQIKRNDQEVSDTADVYSSKKKEADDLQRQADEIKRQGEEIQRQINERTQLKEMIEEMGGHNSPNSEIDKGLADKLKEQVEAYNQLQEKIKQAREEEEKLGKAHEETVERTNKESEELRKEMEHRQKLYDIKKRTTEIKDSSEEKKATDRQEQEQRDLRRREIDQKMNEDKTSDSEKEKLRRERQQLDEEDLKQKYGNDPERLKREQDLLREKNSDTEAKRQQDRARDLAGEANKWSEGYEHKSPTGKQDQVSSQIQDATKKIADGATADEMTKVGDALQVLANAVADKNVEQARQIQNLISRIDQLASQIKNNRSS